MEKQAIEPLEILNDAKVEEVLERLSTKLKEAREIANELASINVVVKDATRKDIHEYEQELIEKFKSHYGTYPDRIVLMAEGQNFAIELSLPCERR